MGRGKGFKRLFKKSFTLESLKLIIVIWLIIGIFYFGFIEIYFFSAKRLLYREKMLKIISKILPSADPGVVNSARYIRHYSITYPTSAFPDFPGEMDYLPSGMFFPPDINILKDKK